MAQSALCVARHGEFAVVAAAGRSRPALGRTRLTLSPPPALASPEGG